MSRIRIAAALTLAAALPLALAAPASAAPSATAGLYGSQDPTYDGVFRQSLAILGLDAVGAPQSPTAVRWLLNAQCADGSFQEFRADLAKACDPVDPTAFTGPDTNATSAAAAALDAIGTSASKDAADRAIAWLLANQGADGGWSFSPGAPSDANSTGMVLSALRAHGHKRTSPQIQRGANYLSTLIAPCGTADGGGLSYQPGAKVDGSASAQGLLGLAGFLPVPNDPKLGANPTCAKGATQRVASFLASRLAAKGALTSAMGGGIDDTNTANAVLGLVAAGVGKPVVAKAMATLRSQAKTYAQKDGKPVPAAIGLLLMAAHATGANTKSFGGINLVNALAGSERK